VRFGLLVKLVSLRYVRRHAVTLTRDPKSLSSQRLIICMSWLVIMKYSSKNCFCFANSIACYYHYTLSISLFKAFLRKNLKRPIHPDLSIHNRFKIASFVPRA
jgi:hypothetical protein